VRTDARVGVSKTRGVKKGVDGYGWIQEMRGKGVDIEVMFRCKLKRNGCEASDASSRSGTWAIMVIFRLNKVRGVIAKRAVE